MDGKVKVISMFLLATLISGISGCATMQTTATSYDDRTPYPPTNPAFVKIFKTTPPQEFIKIGEIQATDTGYTEGNWRLFTGKSNNQAFDDELKLKASQIGGDAVIIIDDQSLSQEASASVYSYKDSTSGRVSTGQSGRKITGIVIKFKELQGAN